MSTEKLIPRQLDGYRLTTAEILYHLPDHPSVLQSLSGRISILLRVFPCCAVPRFLGAASWRASSIPCASPRSMCSSPAAGATPPTWRTCSSRAC